MEENEKGGLRREVCEEQRWLAVTTNPICICLLFLAKMACCDRNFLFVILLYFCYAVIFRLALHQYRFVVCCFFCLLYAAYLVRVYILCDFLICYLVYCVFGLCYDFEVKNCMTTALWGLGLFTLRCLCTFFADSLTCRGTVWLHFFCCVFETFMVISLCHSCVFLCLLYGVYLLCARFWSPKNCMCSHVKFVGSFVRYYFFFYICKYYTNIKIKLINIKLTTIYLEV